MHENFHADDLVFWWCSVAAQLELKDDVKQNQIADRWYPNWGNKSEIELSKVHISYHSHQISSPKTMRKQCLSTKFSHLEIRWKYGILRSFIFIFLAKIFLVIFLILKPSVSKGYFLKDVMEARADSALL